MNQSKPHNTMTMDVHVRPYQKGDEKHLSEILQQIYEQEFNDEYWWWKYLQNPLGANFCHCALHADRLVGFAGGLPYRIKWGTREITGAQITDVLVAPELQGKKVFSRVQKANLEDIQTKADLFYGFTNEHSYRVYSTNYDYAFRVPRMIKILNAVAWLKHRRKSWFSAIVWRILGVFADLGFRVVERLTYASGKSSILVRQIDRFDKSVDTFLETISPAFKIMHIRNHHYLNWRYCDHPLYQYSIFIAEEEGRIVGFVVLRHDPGPPSRGLMLEFMALPDRRDVQHQLISTTVRHFKSCGAAIVTCWMFPHSPYFKTLKRRMFLNHQGDLIVLYGLTNPNDQLKADFKNPLNWHIACGDDESF